KKENEQITNEKISKFESKYLETNKKINDIGDEFLNLINENEVLREKNNSLSISIQQVNQQLLNQNTHLDEMFEKKFKELELNLQKEQGNINKKVDNCFTETKFLNTKVAVAIQYLKKTKMLKEDYNFQNLKVSEIENLLANDSNYFNFEQQFRGPEHLIKERQKIYVDDVRKAFNKCSGYLLEVGGGRGEFLELCKENEIPAKGIDLNEFMIEVCKKKGLDSIKGNVIEFLYSVDDESLCAITAFQVVEHLSQEELNELIELALVKLKPGGVIILETVNPDSILALKNFYIDPTHQKPINSQTLRYLLEVTGFSDVKVCYSSPVSDYDKLKGEDDNTNKLNELLYGYQDYAVKGWK
ncbi:MAG: 2-polyprenyl-3-methyl-5-hydroxy-6-metoxy-1,4-benzoquinol methylase, partial [Clostridium sp.]